MRKNNWCRTCLCVAWCLVMLGFAAGVQAENSLERDLFDSLLDEQWEKVFFDAGTKNWQELWALDGEKAVVSNSDEGLTIDASEGFAVLWTKASFEGDLLVEYDFKRLDSQNSGVNIIYLQAIGDGQDGHAEDISQWSDRRTKALMRNYFNNMHTYHISYAAYPGDYVRGRRYLPLLNQKLDGTDLTGEINNTGIFEDQEWIRIRIIKRAKDLFVEFCHPTKTLLCHLENTDKPGIGRGRVGLRLMPGRRSLFRNLQVHTTPQQPARSPQSTE